MQTNTGKRPDLLIADRDFDQSNKKTIQLSSALGGGVACDLNDGKIVLIKIFSSVFEE